MDKYEPQEHPDFPHFYRIPKFSHYVINVDGLVLNTKMRKEVKPHLNFNGYLVHHLYDDNGINRTIPRHRLLMLVFKNPGDKASELTVDHVDGNKLNNSLSNLEWVDARENIRRAKEQGKYYKDEAPICPIETLNPFTGEIKYYPSIAQCTQALNLGRSSIQYRLTKGPDKVFPEGLQYRKAAPGTPWKRVSSPEHRILANGVSKKGMILNLETGEVLQFDTLTDVARYLRILPSTITCLMKLRDDNQPILPKGFLFKYVSDPNPWRDCNYWDEYSSVNLLYKPVEVCVDNVLYRYERLVEAAHEHKLKITTAHHRVSTHGKGVFSDGSRWGYYPELTQLFNVPSGSNARVITLLTAGRC